MSITWLWCNGCSLRPIHTCDFDIFCVLTIFLWEIGYNPFSLITKQSQEKRKISSAKGPLVHVCNCSRPIRLCRGKYVLRPNEKVLTTKWRVKKSQVCDDVSLKAFPNRLCFMHTNKNLYTSNFINESHLTKNYMYIYIYSTAANSRLREGCTGGHYLHNIICSIW